MILHKRQIVLVLLEIRFLGGICVLGVVLADAGLQMCNILQTSTDATDHWHGSAYSDQNHGCQDMVDGMMTNHTHTITMMIMRCTFVFTHVQHIHADIPCSIHVCMPLHMSMYSFTHMHTLCWRLCGWCRSGWC